MAFVAAPNIIMAEARATVEGQQVENRFMCHSPTAVTAAKLEAVAIAVWNWWELAYANILPTSVNLREVLTTDLTVQNGDQFTYAPDTTTFGTVAGTALPNEVSLCISFRSGVRGRSARGRMYVIAVPRGEMADANNVLNTYRSSAAAVGQSLIDNLASEAPLTIVSYVNNKAPRPGGPVYFLVEAAVVVDTIVDSQRRRKPGIGT